MQLSMRFLENVLTQTLKIYRASSILIRKIAIQINLLDVFFNCEKEERDMLQYYIFYSMYEIRNVIASAIMKKV